MKHKLHKKGSVPLSFFSVSVTKSVRNCGLVSFTEEILGAKLYFLYSVLRKNIPRNTYDAHNLKHQKRKSFTNIKQ